LQKALLTGSASIITMKNAIGLFINEDDS